MKFLCVLSQVSDLEGKTSSPVHVLLDLVCNFKSFDSIQHMWRVL